MNRWFLLLYRFMAVLQRLRLIQLVNNHFTWHFKNQSLKLIYLMQQSDLHACLFHGLCLKVHLQTLRKLKRLCLLIAFTLLWPLLKLFPLSLPLEVQEWALLLIQIHRQRHIFLLPHQNAFCWQIGPKMLGVFSFFPNKKEVRLSLR